MALWSKAKNWLEWLQLAKFVGDLLVTGFSFQAIKIMLSHIPQISPNWASALALLSAGIILWVIVWWQQRYGGASSQQQIQKSGDSGHALLMKTDKFDLPAIHAGFKMFDHRITDESRHEITKALINLQGQERETVLIESVVSLTWGLTFYYIWTSIYGSQVRALNELNRHQLTRETLHPFYAEAALAYPHIYANYGFEKWIGFLRSYVLIIDIDDRIGMTIKGQAFLKFLLDCSLSDKDRLY